MYIIEKALKIFFKLAFKKNSDYLIADDTQVIEDEDVIKCKHNFMPVDSTGNILACSKCGYLISKQKLLKRKKN